MGRNLIDLIESSEVCDTQESKMDKASARDIAIIGIGLRLSNANSAEEFWDSTAKGKSLIRRIPEARKDDVDNYFAYMGTDPGSIKYEEAAYLEEIDKFDYRFFNLSPKEAALMDPNQRLFLETTWESIEDAGYGGDKIAGTRTGVYVGFSNEPEYKRVILDVEPNMYSIAVPGNLAPIIASRISYLLDLKGPSLIVNTACSSSLIAVHLACEAIKKGECSMAVAGGVQVHILPVRQAVVGIESPDNRTRTFDNSSNGTGGGEGVIAMLLKPLAKAQKDGDNIYAVIKGSASNQDGASIGISAPNPAAQADVILRAWKDAGIDPETISYIEAHGTGTKLGDPIEIDGIQRAFRKHTKKKQFCAVASVKSNMGHLDASAGIAGLLRAALALKNKKLPPALNFERPNRSIPFHKSPVYVNTELTDWETMGSERRCGVSSFGFSGTNCHIVLEEAPAAVRKRESKAGRPNILTLSAKTEAGLRRLINQYCGLECRTLGLENICYTASTGRGHYSHRAALLIDGSDDFDSKLRLLSFMEPDSVREPWLYYGTSKAAASEKDISGNGELRSEQKSELNSRALQVLEKYIKGNKSSEDLLHELCRLYVKGADINWEKLYRGEAPSKVSLPKYPFEKTRCWINIPLNNRNNREGKYYSTVWKQNSLDLKSSSRKKGSILVLSSGSEKSREITALLRENENTVIEVRLGSEFQRLNEEAFIVSGSREDYARLFESLESKGIAQIVHLLSIENDNKLSALDDLELRLRNGIHSLHYLAAILLNMGLDDIDMVLLSQYGYKVSGREKKIYPENAALYGLGKVINVENYSLRCRCIDIDELTDKALIAEEIEAGYSRYSVAYREGLRYCQELTDIDISSFKTVQTEIREDGVYIITGGAGGIGLEISKYLASEAKVNIALINRSELPPREEWDRIIREGSGQRLAGKIAAIREIEAAGALVEYCKADISIEESIKPVIDKLREKHGKINGIIHSAGVGAGSQGKTLREDDEEVFRQVLSPKIQGTWLLDKLTKQDALDFFVVFTSPITITGGIGSGSYTAANSYLDSFAAYRSRLGKRTIAMSWAPWQKTIQSMNIQFKQNKQLFRPLSTRELVGAFEELLNKDIEIACVGRLNHDSEIFLLDGIVPFTFSESVKSRFNKAIGEKERSNPDAINGGLGDVKLEGRDSGEYSEAERAIAATFRQVLGYNEYNINDNFYELGGDSIIALKAVNVLNKLMKLEINAVELFKHPVIKDFAALLDRQRAEKGYIKYSSIPLAPAKEYYGTASPQKRIFLINQREGVGVSWHISYFMVVEGKLDTARLEDAFRELVKRHEVLRTSFHLIKGELMQKINQSIDFSIEYAEFEGEDIEELKKSFIRPYDLTQTPLFRVRLLKMNEQNHLLMFDIHHIISDEITMEVLMRELCDLYEGKALPEPVLQYKDFAEWQNQLLQSGDLKAQEAYWTDLFSDGVPLLELPTDFPRPAVQSFEGERVYFEFSRELTYSLNKLVQQTNTTAYWVLMSIFNILLAKYSGQEDIVVGAPIYGRFHPDVDNTLGMFVNVLPLRSRLSRDMTFAEFLQEVKENLINAYANQNYPFDRTVEKLKLTNNEGRNPLFDVSFQQHKIVLREISLSDNLRFIPVEHEDNTAKQDLVLEMYEADRSTHFILIYCTKLFRRESIDKLIDSFKFITMEIIKNPDIRISDIRLTSSKEIRSIVDAFNEDLESI